jgi:uncharacterized membrane protein
MNLRLDHVRQHVGRNRLLSVDPLRGFAMVLVILAHAYLSVNAELIPRILDMFLWGVTYSAAVAFVSISGTMFSYFLYAQPNWTTAYRRYAARAAFLLLVAHPAINLTSYCFRVAGKGNSSGGLAFLKQLILDFPITDTIAVCLLVSPLFILRMGTRLKAGTIVALLTATPFVRAFLNPAEPHLLMLKEAIFGGLGMPSVFWWPLAPWLAIFLAGSFVGQALARLKQGTLKAFTLVRELNNAGITLAICSVIFTLGYKILKMGFERDWSPDLFLAIYPSQTTTLLPGYFAVLAWFFASLMRRIDISGRYDRFLWFLSILGRTSLFTFVIQFAVVESVPALLDLKGTLGLGGFLVLFVVGLTVVWVLSYGYGRMRGWFSETDYAECVATARANQVQSA